MERILTQELIEDLKNADPEEFGDDCERESDKWAISFRLRYYIVDKELGIDDFPKGDIFKIVDAYHEKGDEKDEKIIYGIFLRKSDKKHFSLWIHAGPETLIMCDYLEEVVKIKGKRIKWKKNT
jgi:hypothetical protein